jgi:sulfur carrier protein ThiS
MPKLTEKEDGIEKQLSLAHLILENGLTSGGVIVSF